MAIVAGGLAACEREAAAPPAPTSVIVVTARIVDYAPTIALTGEVAARVTSELSFRTGGRILERKVEVGQHITADQVLATIDGQEQMATLDAAKATVQAAQAQLRQASSAFDRQKALIRQGYTTRRDYDSAEESFRSAQGSLDVARAQLGTAQDALSQTELKAGVAGIVTARSAEAGQVVQAAQSVFTIAQDGPRDAVFNVFESIFAREPASREIPVSLVSDPSIAAVARLREISPALDPANGTIRVKFEIIDPPPALTLGAVVSGAGRFRPRQAIVVPWSAMSSDAGRPALWVVDPATKAVGLRPITVEAFEVGQTVIRDGIRPGETIVVRGQQLLRPNQVVTPIEESAS